MSKREMECEAVGEEMADIAGIGIIVGFVGQAFISLALACWVFLLTKIGNVDIHHDEGTVEYMVERKRLWIISDILMIGNDIQMLLGVSYMVTIFIRLSTMDTYHLHLVYDIVSFVGVSNAAALVFWTFCASKITKPDSKWRSRLRPSRDPNHVSLLAPRYRVTYGFAAMFLVLTIVLCVRLDQWSPDNEPGRCYNAYMVTQPGVAHPAADKIYVAVTAVWLLLVMTAAVLLGTKLRRPILVMSGLQFPVHLYMALALRSANQGLLEGEENHENGWDFGQTTAVLLLVLAFGELWRKGYEYFKFERELRKRGMSHVALKVRSVSSERVSEEGAARDGRMENERERRAEHVPLESMLSRPSIDDQGVMTPRSVSAERTELIEARDGGSGVDFRSRR